MAILSKLHIKIAVKDMQGYCNYFLFCQIPVKHPEAAESLIKQGKIRNFRESEKHDKGVVCLPRQGSGRTGVAAFSGQIEANRGNGRISDYCFTTPLDSEKKYDFVL